MTTPSDDNSVEEVVYELEPSRVPKPIPVALEDLCKQTKFSRQEIRIMYRGFKTVSVCYILFYNSSFYIKLLLIEKRHFSKSLV